MHALILSTILSLPIYPLNPVAEDTVNALNAHVALGFAAPNGVVNAGPELSTHLELSLGHPFIVRTSADLRAGSVSTRPWPKGSLFSTTFSTDVLYYHGTNKLTAYVGAGVLYTLNSFDADSHVLDSLYTLDGITDVRYESNAGFRITVGIRFRKVYCFEMAFSRMRNQFVFDRRLSPNMIAFTHQEVAVSDARLSFGYVIPLRK